MAVPDRSKLRLPEPMVPPPALTRWVKESAFSLLVLRCMLVKRGSHTGCEAYISFPMFFLVSSSPSSPSHLPTFDPISPSPHLSVPSPHLQSSRTRPLQQSQSRSVPKTWADTSYLRTCKTSVLCLPTRRKAENKKQSGQGFHISLLCVGS